MWGLKYKYIKEQKNILETACIFVQSIILDLFIGNNYFDF